MSQRLLCTLKSNLTVQSDWTVEIQFELHFKPPPMMKKQNKTKKTNTFSVGFFAVQTCLSQSGYNLHMPKGHIRFGSLNKA